MGAAVEDLEVGRDHDPVELGDRPAGVEASTARREQVMSGEVAKAAAARAPLVEVAHQHRRKPAVTLGEMGHDRVRLTPPPQTGQRYRYIDDRAANEDNSVIAKGYFLTDAVISYTHQKFEVGFSAENIFNTDWNEAQFDTESRLISEDESVSEIHFTPGTPLFLKLKLTLFF
jgi:hypothetical protein